MPLAAALAMVLLSNPQLLQRLSGHFQKIFPGRPDQPVRGVGQPPRATEQGGLGGFAQTLGARGPLPMGLQLAQRLPGIYGAEGAAPEGVADEAATYSPWDQPITRGYRPTTFGAGITRFHRPAYTGTGTRAFAEAEPVLPAESMTEARNRLARSLLDQYGGDVAKAAAAYRRVIFGEEP